jgi:hypothetical protein
MREPSEPESETTRALTGRDRRALVRFLRATGLWPLRLPELVEPQRAKPRKRRSEPRQPWDPKPPSDR